MAAGHEALGMTEGSGRSRSIFFPDFLRSIGLLCLVFLAGIPFKLVAGSLARSVLYLGGGPWLLDTLRNLLELGAYIALFVWGLRHAGRKPGASMPLRPVPVKVLLLFLLAQAGTTLTLGWVGDVIAGALPPVPEFLRAKVERESALALVFVGPTQEELLFRGVILFGFLAHYSRRKAIFLCALLFALDHLSPWQLIPAFGAGALYSWVTAESGSLVPALLGHVLNNGIATLGIRNAVDNPRGIGLAIGATTLGLGIYLLGMEFRTARSKEAPHGA